jgi:LuxR family maltose regulon positive regulatory protein
MRLHTTAPSRDKSAIIEYIQGLLGHAGDLPDAGLMQPLEQELVEPLTKRELVMLEMIASGLSNKGIAANLHVTESTVKWHLGNIYSKMGVKKRTQAIANGRQLGLIS